MSPGIAQCVRASLRVLLMMSLTAAGASCGRGPTPPISVPPPPVPPPPPPPVPPPPPPPPPPSITVSIAGNIGDCGAGTDNATALLLDSLPGLIIAAGDNAFEDGTLRDYQECFGPSWGRHLPRMYAAMGNHDYQTGSAGDAFDYFGARAGVKGEGWFSIDLDSIGWRIIVLNDNAPYVSFEPGSAQETWLRTALTTNPRPCVLAVFHEPRFLSSNTPGFTSRPSHYSLWQTLYGAGVELVVNAQQHHYERMQPMNPAGGADNTRGILQFNAGTAGGNGSMLPTAAIHPNSVVRSAAFGVLSLKLRDGGYDWTFVPARGETFTDTGTGTCH